MTDKGKYKLTPEHRAMLAPWADRWIANAMSTAAMVEEDRVACVQAVRGLYAAAKLPAPRVIFVSSPFVAAFAAGFAGGIWHMRKTSDPRIKLTTLATQEVTREAVWGATVNAALAATWGATQDATRDAALIATQATRAILEATQDAVRAAAQQAASAATRDVTREAAWDATLTATKIATWDASWDATADATADVTRAAADAATQDAVRVATRIVARDATHYAAQDATWSATWGATQDAIQDAIQDSTRNAIRNATQDVGLAATQRVIHGATQKDSLGATMNVILNATGAATWGATWNATQDATQDATQATQKNKTDNSLLEKWYAFDVSAMVGVACALSPNIDSANFLLKCAESAHKMFQGGNQWSAYESHISFFQDVAQLDLPQYEQYQHWRVLSERSGPRYLHPEFCIVSDRPETLTVDDQNRPHSATGPFCRWRDGAALYSVHGARVPGWIVECPERISVATIEAERNQEIRRMMIDRYRLGEDVSGAAAYMRDCGAKIEDADERWGTLLRKRREDDTDLLMLRVINRTPEPDGRFKEYYLRIHPKLCPMLPDGSLGAPQKPTALNAVASTFGLTGGKYAKQIGALDACES